MASQINSGGFFEERFKMIISDTPIPATQRWLVAAILLCAAGLLPLGVVNAQSPDYEAVAARLEAAVEAGELTHDQAKAMMGELARARFAERAETGRGHRDRAEGVEGDYRRMGLSDETFDKIRAAFSEKGLTPEQTRSALGGMLRVIHELRTEGKEFELDPRLRSYFADEVGLTGEQIELVVGLSRRISIRLGRRGANDLETRSDVDGAALRRRLGAAVESGRMTRDEAGAKWREIMEGAAQSKRDVDGAALRKRLGAAVEAGEMTGEEARAKFREIMGDRREGRDGEHDRKPTIEEIETRLRAAVEAGEITREAARRRLEAARERLAGEERSDEEHSDGEKRRR